MLTRYCRLVLKKKLYSRNRFLANNCSSRCLRRARTCSSWMRRLSFSAIAWLNFWQNWWNILKHSSILNALVSSQKNSASDRLTPSSSSMSLFNCAISCSAICEREILFKCVLIIFLSIYFMYCDIYLNLLHFLPEETVPFVPVYRFRSRRAEFGLWSFWSLCPKY